MTELVPTHVLLVSAIIRNDRGQILIAQRSNNDDQAGGVWSFPGGKVDHYGKLAIVEDTLEKEVGEEVDLEIYRDTIRFVTSQRFIRSSGDSVVGLYFLCEYKSGEAKPLEDQQAVRWVTVEECREIFSQKGQANYALPILDKMQRWL